MEDLTNHIEKSKEYSVLAEIYDAVMHDVDYEAWADYIDEVIMRHHHEAEELLELACGTGTMAISMEELGYYNITATDLSPHMISKAIEKGAELKSGVKFKTIDFLNIDIGQKFDAVYMVFDSLNYIHKKEDILTLHNQVYNVLKPGGIFVYDFTTPRNSRKSIQYLNEEKSTVNGKYSYHRTSAYDDKQRIHTNVFEIQQLNYRNPELAKNFREEHKQRIYTMNEIYPIVQQSPFNLVKAYDGFELKPAHKRSLRITMVLR